jgi:hypothetical protein
MDEEYICPGIEHDQPFEGTNNHKDENTRRLCDRGNVERDLQKNSAPKSIVAQLGPPTKLLRTVRLGTS